MGQKEKREGWSLKAFSNHTSKIESNSLLQLSSPCKGFPDSSVGKESACNAGDPGSIPGSGRSNGEGIGYPLQYYWASLVSQLVKNPPAMQVEDLGSIPALGRSPREEKGYPLWYSGLENSMDYIVLGIARSQKGLSDFHFHSLRKFEVYSTVLLIQFSSVAQSCPTLCDPMNCNTPGLPVHHQLPEFTQTHVHRVGDAIQPSNPLSSRFPPTPNPSQHQGPFR